MLEYGRLPIVAQLNPNKPGVDLTPRPDVNWSDKTENEAPAPTEDELSALISPDLLKAAMVDDSTEIPPASRPPIESQASKQAALAADLMQTVAPAPQIPPRPRAPRRMPTPAPARPPGA